MILTIILILAIVGSIIGLMYVSYDWEFPLVATLIICGIYFIPHIIIYSLQGYDYNQFKVQRDSFEQTLKTARESGNEYEAAAILKDIAEWNQDLARSQYNNKNAYLGIYIDDRIDKLQPIK